MPKVDLVDDFADEASPVASATVQIALGEPPARLPLGRQLVVEPEQGGQLVHEVLEVPGEPVVAPPGVVEHHVAVLGLDRDI